MSSPASFCPIVEVTTHSIRYRILKANWLMPVPTFRLRYNPFDPIQDTESFFVEWGRYWSERLQPIRSDTGY